MHLVRRVCLAVADAAGADGLLCRGVVQLCLLLPINRCRLLVRRLPALPGRLAGLPDSWLAVKWTGSLTAEQACLVR